MVPFDRVVCPLYVIVQLAHLFELADDIDNDRLRMLNSCLHFTTRQLDQIPLPPILHDEPLEKTPGKLLAEGRCLLCQRFYSLLRGCPMFLRTTGAILPVACPSCLSLSRSSRILAFSSVCFSLVLFKSSISSFCSRSTFSRCSILPSQRIRQMGMSYSAGTYRIC